jgi:hypothetical protein
VYVHFCLQPYALFSLSLPLHIIYLLHLLSTNQKCTQPCYFPNYSNLLLRRRRWTGILWCGVLGYVLPWLPFLWCYGVFRCSISFRVILVFKDIIYVIIILYIRDVWLYVSTFRRMCGTIDPGSCIRWALDFGIKTGYDMYGVSDAQSRWRPSWVANRPHVRQASQGLVSYHLKSMVELTHSTYKYPPYPLRWDADQKVRFSFL